MDLDEVLLASINKTTPSKNTIINPLKPLLENREKIRETLNPKKLPTAKPYHTITAIDGAYTLNPLYLGDHMSFLAITCAATLGTSAVDITEHKEDTFLKPHAPGNDTYIQTLMHTAEIELAANAATINPEAITLIDGTHYGATTTLAEALNQEGTATQYIQRNINPITQAIKTIASAVGVIGATKADSSTDLHASFIADGVLPDLGAVYPDKVVSALVLDEGEYVCLDNPGGAADKLRLSLSVEAPTSAGARAKSLLKEAAAPLLEPGGVKTYLVKPLGASTVLRLELKGTVDGFTTLDYLSAIAADTIPPHSMEPSTQYIVDHLVKSVSHQAKVHLEELKLDLAEDPSVSPLLVDFAYRSYRTS